MTTLAERIAAVAAREAAAAAKEAELEARERRRGVVLDRAAEMVNSTIFRGFNLAERTERTPLLFVSSWEFEIWPGRISVGCIDELVDWWRNPITVVDEFNAKNQRFNPKVARALQGQAQDPQAEALRIQNAKFERDWGDYGPAIVALCDARQARLDRDGPEELTAEEEALAAVLALEDEETVRDRERGPRG